MELSNNGRRMLKAMRDEPSKTWNLIDLLSACDWTDQAHVAGAGAALSEAGLVHQTEARTTLWKLATEGVAAAENGLLEQRIRHGDKRSVHGRAVVMLGDEVDYPCEV